MQKGFTLIELIIVIVILGILAVTAAPRFIDISDDAHEAATRAEAAAFKTSVQLVYGLYQMRQTSPLTVGDQTVYIDSVSGYPTGDGSGAQFCVNLWTRLLNSSETVNGVSNPASALADGWNSFGFTEMCAYGKQYGDRTFASGNLPHFVYYIRDFGPYTYNGQTYQGSAGDVQVINF
ncbi:prepilin-type N-terminal cleavage/methylation domain-containing protein [Glaciecola sp. 1036]|uniref:prepilin-type N-terminal cleavage/methylation domain-containing protein n=1 Tax=Alteromonadaceae TaxID=72275 RepID=UPI003D02F54E